MKCKHCQAELDEGVTLCPECGTENAAPEAEAPVQAEAPAEAAPVQAEAPAQAEPEMKAGLTPGKIALLVALAVAAVAVVIALIVGGMSGNDTPAETSQPSETIGATDGTEPAAATIPADGNPDDVTCKGSYTVTDEEMTAAADTVVATMGEAKLTNADLQVYYWMQVYDFLSNYSSYLSYFGMDYTQSLDTQISMDGTLTWQQYFLDSAIMSWQDYQSMRLTAEANGYELDQEYADYLAALPEQLESSAQSSGFADALTMIQADMGVGANLEGYLEYLRTYYIGYMYYNTQMESIQVTDEEVEAYFDEHAAEYLENGLEKTEDKYVDVRHILLQPEGGTTGEDGTTTYSEVEWEACKLAAEAVLNEWLSGEQTEEHFAELANTHSTDGGSNTNGGLYTDVYVGQMVEPFENWCFDEARKTGDYGIVQTDYGYHVMYFVDSDPIWYATAWNDLMSQKGDEFLQSVLDANPMEIDYSLIALGDVSLVATN